MIVHQLTIPAPCEWVNANQRGHWAKRARLTKTWRTAARLWARKAGLPTGLVKVHVVATVHKATNRSYDAHNLNLTAKACIDGLVDYGLIPDDSNAYLVGPDMRAGAKGQPRLVLTIQETE